MEMSTTIKFTLFSIRKLDPIRRRMYEKKKREYSVLFSFFIVASKEFDSHCINPLFEDFSITSIYAV